MARLNDTKAIADRNVGGCYAGLNGTAEFYRKDRAIEEAIQRSFANPGQPVEIKPRGLLAGDSSCKALKEELNK